MNTFSKATCSLLVVASLSIRGYSQTTAPLTLNTLDAFRDPGKNWIPVSDISFDLNKPDGIKSKNGTGILVNTKNGANLISKEELGDVELDLDFMVSKGSGSGIFIQGLYEISLSDSWTKLNPSSADLGGISPRSDGAGYEFSGLAPIMNVAKAPGLWQHLKIRFRAAQFNASGIKTANARFEEVYLNGKLIQEEAELTGPSKGASGAEKASGPLVFRGDAGAVAFRNISYRSPAANSFSFRRNAKIPDPILLEAGSTPYLLRSYLNYGNKKLTHVISLGSASGLNYSYDLKQGALLQIWRGKFADVTEMWDGRGEPQLAKPNGSVIILSSAPALAVLADQNAVWPESIPFEEINTKGYVLDKERMPTFQYSFKGADINDKISTSGNGESVIREFTITNAPESLYCRISSAKTIETISKGLYAINGLSYYIRVDEQYKPFIRQTPNGQELLVAVSKITMPFSYSIIW